MNINPTIFRLYDIRGIAGKKFTEEEIKTYEKWYGPFPGITLTPDVANAIGKAYGTIIRRSGWKKVVVGYEIRPFAEELKNAFVDGILSTGCDVADASVSLTPVIYFATAFFGFDGGVNVTGSHNVYFYNGFKMMKKDVWPLFGDELAGMRGMIEKNDYISDEKGKREAFDADTPYEDYFLKHVKLSRKLRIVIDAGNGSAGIIAPQLFRKLGCVVVELYTKPDATFPNHTPDPEAPQNMKDLGATVRNVGADLGIGFDADGDRMGFVDENGDYISADLLLLLFAKDALKRNPGKKILYDVKCSQLLQDLIPTYGGIPLMHQTGHAPIKQTLRKDESIIFGGEVSGHFYFVEDYFRFDDGLFSAGKMLEIFSSKVGPFSSLLAEFPRRVRTPEIKLPCADEKKFKVVEAIKKVFEKKFPVILIDGVRIRLTKTGWGLIRPSNTSPYLTLRVEGISEVEVLRVKGILADALEKFPEVRDKLDRDNVAVLKGKLGWI